MRIAAFTTLLVVTMLTAVACGSDDAARSSTDPSATLKPGAFPMTGGAILARAVESFAQASYFEAEYRFETTSERPDIGQTQTGAVRFGGPGRYYVRTVDDDDHSELIALGRTYYSRRGAPEDIALLEWTQFTAGGVGSNWDEIPEFFTGLQLPDTITEKDGEYRLAGFRQPGEEWIFYGGGPSGITFDMVGGPYTLIVDSETFAPLFAEYETTTSWANSRDPENIVTWDVIRQHAIDFLSFNEPVSVDAPANARAEIPPSPTSTSP